ncbi:MAG TPA: YraN family protein [Dehalococcoidales bacterium]
MKRSETGLLGEKLAQNFLKKKGYRILENNYRCRYGEIDIVARQGQCLVFVEVRTKNNLKFGTPEESISYSKMQHMEQAAEFYAQEHRTEGLEWRIDLIAIELDANLRVQRIEQIENALQ